MRTRRAGTMVASAVMALGGLMGTAAPAQAAPAVPNCWASATIYPSGMSLYAAASTHCAQNAQQMRAKVQIRYRDPSGFIWYCGTYDDITDFNVPAVTARTSCIGNGQGYTYWAYSEHWASVNGESVYWNSGNWNG